MRCEICNKLLSENSSYCPFCGSKVEPRAQEGAHSTGGAYFTTTDDTYSLAFLEEVLEKQKEAKKKKHSIPKEEPLLVNDMVFPEHQVADPVKKRKLPILPIVLGAALLISIVIHIFQFVSYIRLTSNKNSLAMENEWLSKQPEILKELLLNEYDRGHETGYQTGFEEGYSLGYDEGSGNKTTPTVNTPTRTPSTRTPSTRAPATKTPATPAPATQAPNTVTKKEDKKCAYTGCYNSPLSNIPYCSRHKCVKENCHNPIANDYAGYCANHKCSIPRCGSPRAWNSIFCDQHGD